MLALWCAAQAECFSSAKYATYRQWGELDAQVRRHEKGNPVVFWKIQNAETEDRADDEPGRRIFARTSWVFNADQVDGYDRGPPLALPAVAERLEEAERYIANLGAAIEHGGNKAFYRPSTDTVRLPVREAFRSTEAYYSVAAHEICGH